MLLHAKSRWPKVITTNLWPYALRCANDALNNTPRGKDKQGKERGIPMSIFTSSEAHAVTRHFHPFGCPTYVLNSKLQAGQSLPKWLKKARLGVYLGRSPRHAQSVALAMNLSTGLVSPAFQVGFDDHFKTLSNHNDYPNRWKAAAHFGRFFPKKRKKMAMKDATQGSSRGLVNETANESPTSNDIQEQDTGSVPTDDDIPVDNEGSDDPRSNEIVDGQVPILVPRNQLISEPTAIPEPTTVRWSARHKPTQRRAVLWRRVLGF